MLINGFAVMPETIYLINATLKEQANHAGILAIADPGVPDFVFVSEKPVLSFLPEDDARIFALCCEEFEKVDELRKRNSNLEFSIFAIPEVSDVSDWLLGTGIIREG
jgi:hypothetical protein